MLPDPVHNCLDLIIRRILISQQALISQQPRIWVGVKMHNVHGLGVSLSRGNSQSCSTANGIQN